MPKKTVASNFNAIDKKLTYDIKIISKILKSFFSSLAESLLFNYLYCSVFLIHEMSHIENTPEEKVILQ